ncbi:hypothetical protein T265_10320 [Opisthorchis viverrini]|uniref:Uncharacterized protein n=1 Tax=Opisthorchis viverrini TaxID=6198 RepID=A0A074Z6W9_OPIVI|nr:hypothetical protein T265_10320 [Opisthorchis viverrini]KER21317.1 hypothetical protein T265_10320 [Opisthorchis viverrini]
MQRQLTKKSPEPVASSPTSICADEGHNATQSCERQPLTDKNKTDPGNLGNSLDPLYQSVNPRILN